MKPIDHRVIHHRKVEFTVLTVSARLSSKGSGRAESVWISMTANLTSSLWFNGR